MDSAVEVFRILMVSFLMFDESMNENMGVLFI